MFKRLSSLDIGVYPFFWGGGGVRGKVFRVIYGALYSKTNRDLLSLLVLDGTVELTLSSKSSLISHRVGGNSHSCPPTSIRPRSCWTSSSEEDLFEEINIIWCKSDTI